MNKINLFKIRRSKLANIPFASTFVTHERLSLEPYQTWQYCEVADIEPFQGQSDQIFQFSIIQNRVRIPFYLRANWKGAGGSSLRLSLLPPRKVGERRKRTWESLRFLSFCPIKARWKRKEHARENIKRCVNAKTQKRESLDPTFRAMPAILVPSDHRCGSM